MGLYRNCCEPPDKVAVIPTYYDNGIVLRKLIAKLRIKRCQGAASSTSAGEQNDFAVIRQPRRCSCPSFRLAGLKCIMHRDTSCLKFFGQRGMRDEEAIHSTLRHIGAASIARRHKECRRTVIIQFPQLRHDQGRKRMDADHSIKGFCAAGVSSRPTHGIVPPSSFSYPLP